MVSFENITKGYGPHTLFEGATFKINPKERIGLVGRNGHGKTTLLRMIVGEEAADDGSIVIPKNYRIGYVRQRIEFTGRTVLEEGITGLPDHEKDQAWKVEKVLAGLGFTDADLQRDPLEFSGGFQVRLNLAKTIVSEPDLLLLDEPTNYLDITSIRWVVRFLRSWPRELMLITHDRTFMDRVVSHTVGIHRKKVRKIEGDTGKYYDQIAQEEEIYEKTRIRDERRRKEVEQFIRRFRAKARLANMVQSRIKTLEKTEKRDQLDEIRELEFAFRSKPFAGKHVMSIRNLSFGYASDQPLIRDLSLSVGPRERICVVGRNGKGKTTLLKLLAGELKSESGDVTFNPQVESGYFEQGNIASLVDSHTVEQEIMAAHPDVDRQLSRNICGAMMFEGDSALKKISVLSGGEKSRVMLGRLLVTPVNLLLLDEPSNHLDLESCDALLAAIDSFDGVVIMVTHNEMFIHALADRLVVFQKGGIEVFDGSYSRFLQAGGWAEEAAGESAGSVEASGPFSGPKLSKKDLRRLRSETINERSRALRPIETRISNAEDEIDEHERALADLNVAMEEASRAGDGPRIGELSREMHRHQGAIDRLFEDLEQASDELEKRRVEFDDRLNEIDSETL